MRDAEEVLRQAHSDWALACFDATLAHPVTNHVLQVREGLAYNPLAISFAGRLLALRQRRTPDDMRAVLLPAACGVHEIAHGLGEAIEAVLAVEPMIVKSLLRCATHACIGSRTRWIVTPEEKASFVVELDRLATQATDAELHWLAGAGAEPDWPSPPLKASGRRARLRLPGASLTGAQDVTLTEASAAAEESDGGPSIDLIGDADGVDPPWFNHQSAALWLRQLRDIQAAQCPWLTELVHAFTKWTMTANGLGLPKGEQVDDPPREWNEAFFSFVAKVAPHDDVPEALALIEPILRLADQNFFDVTGILTRALDEAYFGQRHPSTAVAVGIRNALAEHMTATWGWRRAQGQRDGFTERYLGMAIAGMFFNSRAIVSPSTCYLTPLGIDRLGDFIPTLQAMVVAGPCFKVAEVMLNLAGVSPRAEHLPLLAQACRRWLEAFGDLRVFWVDRGVGSRWCNIVQSAIKSHTGPMAPHLASELAHLTAELVALGIAEAPPLEATLTSR